MLLVWIILRPRGAVSAWSIVLCIPGIPGMRHYKPRRPSTRGMGTGLPAWGQEIIVVLDSSTAVQNATAVEYCFVCLSVCLLVCRVWVSLCFFGRET